MTRVLADVDPRAYLINVLDKLCRGWPASRLDELLLSQWAAAKKAAEQAEAERVA